MSNHTPGPWRYEAGGGHAYNRIVGSDCVQTNGWPEPINGVSNASYSERVCENLGDIDLPGPAANIKLICAAPELLAALENIANASPRDWSERDEFKGWAQSLARTAIALATGAFCDECKAPQGQHVERHWASCRK